MTPPVDPIDRARRRDRAAEDDEWIRAFLRESQYGVVATESGGQPFINPLLFVYDEETHTVHFHTGREGRIFANIAANPQVCFNVCQMGELAAGTDACRFDVAYESVVVFGRSTVIGDTEEAARALRLLLAKYFPDSIYGEDYTPITPEQLARTAVYRLDIEAWSAKRNA